VIMSFWSALGERLSDLREQATELWQNLVAGGEAELGEYDIFDETEAEEELESVEQEIEEIEEIIDVEPGEIDFPDWVSDEDIETIINDIGVTRYDDLMESEKDEYITGWRGIEEADEIAKERDDWREEMQSYYGIPNNVMDALTDDELMMIEQLVSNNAIGLAREFEELEPEDIAEELEMSFRDTFIDWQSFVQSNLYGFLVDRPDLFDIYVTDEGEIEVYEHEES
jgi:hypothetical protein